MQRTADATDAIEGELIERSQAGDGAAYGRLVERHQAAVYNVACRLLGDGEEARDVAQEAFWRAYRGLGSFERGRPLAPWLYRIATNLSLNRLRSRRSRPALSLDGMGGKSSPPIPPDPRPGPAGLLMQSQVQARVRQAILALPPPDRAVVELRHFQGLAYDEIAHTLGTTVGSVKSRLYRARQQLQAALADLIDQDML